MRRLTCARVRLRFVVHGGDVLVHDMARYHLTKWTNSIHRRGNEFACGMIVMICLLRIPQFFVWCKMWDLGFRSGAPQASRYVDFQANPAARTEFGSPPTPSGSAFAQPPRSPAPSSTPPPPRPVQSMVVSPTAVAPPAPLAPPAVVSFTPSGGDAYQPQ
ncbi:hypothetical protein BE221DRAFT_71871 [Ostreococcus tauri]|uniref:Uncharacterized protein n=1 Tax=Ostreococcus tauri TaxID=70448 RepID=A0A1Y5IH65_OSTTA|nr:hypothetical protein BE221DRAFT_71871 [Ostreococcus tauri]